jgi:hypothetical protein
MIANSIAECLETYGNYRSVPQPLHIADVDFDFAGALTGPDAQQALTLILEENADTIGAALRRLRAFTVVLERSGSTRPINVILISEDPNREVVLALEQLARVIVVQPGTEVRDSLYCLLPLHLPQPIEQSQSAEKTFHAEHQKPISPIVQRLLRAGKRSASAVEEEMRKALTELAEKREE